MSFLDPYERNRRFGPKQLAQIFVLLWVAALAWGLWTLARWLFG